LRQLRQTFKRPAVQQALSWIAAQYIRLVWVTGRWQMTGEEPANHLFEQGKPLIIAAWHGRLFMMPCGWRYRGRMHVLISSHGDGQLISKTMAHFGMRTIAGSTRKGGAEALLRLRRILRDGGAVGITPDGPRGPRMRASLGIVQLARMTDAPIFPLTYSARPRHIFGSWDRFILPLPFSRGQFLWGDAIIVPKDADDATMEAKRDEVEHRLTELTNQADDMVNQPRIAPAEIEIRS
jgi:lysophospholipid acyltransferase (LPLAT)-like uncharacterized protein